MIGKIKKGAISFFTVFVLVVTCNNTFALDAPMLVVAISGINVSISWSVVSDATGYTLYYAPMPYTGPETIQHVDMSRRRTVSATLWDGASYYVAATAQNQDSESEFSNIETIITIDSSTSIARYVDNGDGTISDSSTGLMWQSVGSSRNYGDYTSSYCSDLTDGGYTDWHVPGKSTLSELIYCSNGTETPLSEGETCGENDSYVIPTIDPIFSSVEHQYWTASIDEASHSSTAWVIDFSNGASLTESTIGSQSSGYNYFRCVRGEVCDSDHFYGCQYAGGEAAATVLFSLQSFDQQLSLLQGLVDNDKLDGVIGSIDDSSTVQELMNIIEELNVYRGRGIYQILTAIYESVSRTPREVINEVILSDISLALSMGNTGDGSLGLIITDLALANPDSNDPIYQYLYAQWVAHTLRQIYDQCGNLEYASHNLSQCAGN